MRVVNLRTDKYTRYIGRGSLFGNPFKIGKDGTRQEVIQKYERWIQNYPQILEAIYALPPDDILGCYCKPKECHGDVIVRLWKEMHR